MLFRSLNINIQEEQRKAQESLTQQGLRVLVCAGTGCVANGALKVIEKFKELGADVSVLSDYDKITIVPTGCHGFCEQGVLVVIPDKHVTYVKVKEKDVEEIYESHIKNNTPVERLLYVDPKTREHVQDDEHINFYAKQTRTALKNCGNINAECIDEAIAVRGYEALAKVLQENNPDGVIDVIEKSGLRGRGGGGFPTGRKWRFTAANKGGKSYIVCNGDEGDPGAFMDRSVMEGDPHKLLEGMAIAAFAIGADEGYIYVRAEYPLAIKRLRKAIADAEERNFLGKNIMGSNFSLEIHIKEGAGAFVCGEETALIASHFQSLIAIKRHNLCPKLNESLVYRCLKGSKLCLCLLEILSLNRDRQVSLLLNPLSALNNLLFNDVIVNSSVIIEAIIFLSNQNLVTEFIHVFVLIVDRNLVITVQRI